MSAYSNFTPFRTLFNLNLGSLLAKDIHHIITSLSNDHQVRLLNLYSKFKTTTIRSKVFNLNKQILPNQLQWLNFSLYSLYVVKTGLSKFLVIPLVPDVVEMKWASPER